MIRKMGIKSTLIVLAFMMAFASYSCNGKSGKLWIGSSYGENRSISQLVENWEDYHVYYAREGSAKTTAILGGMAQLYL